jgi:hypothetical protein
MLVPAVSETLKTYIVAYNIKHSRLKGAMKLCNTSKNMTVYSEIFEYLSYLPYSAFQKEVSESF